MDIGAARNRLDELRSELDEQRTALADLGHRITEAYESGTADVDALGRQRTAAQARVEGLESAITSLEAKIQTAEQDALTSRAKAEITRARRSIGGVAGEHGRHIQRANRLLDELQPIIGRIFGARPRQDWELAGVRALAERFDLEVPESHKLLPMAGGDPPVVEVRQRIQGLLGEVPRAPGPGLQRRTFQERGRAIGEILDKRFAVQSEIAEIMASAGPSPAEVAAAEERDQRARRRQQQEARAMPPAAPAAPVPWGERF